MTDINSLVVPGEASESDDEDYMSPIHKGAPLNILGAEEACDSDDDINITMSAFASRFEESNPKYNTRLHKKLRESNWRLRNEIQQFAKTSFTFAGGQINEVNQKLLASQVDTQETVKLLRKSSNILKKMNSSLGACLSTPYIPQILLR